MNDASQPRRVGQPGVPEPRWARRTKYGRGNPIKKYNSIHKWRIFIWVILIWMAAAQSSKPTPIQRGPRCFLAVPQRRGWWNTKARHTSGYKPQIRAREAGGAHAKTTGTQLNICRRLLLYELNTKNNPPRNHPLADVSRPACLWAPEPSNMCQVLRPPVGTGPFDSPK